MTEAGVRRAGTLRLRIVSALVLLPLALAAVWVGPPLIDLIVAVAGVAMAWEWGRLLGRGLYAARDLVIVASVTAAICGVAAEDFRLALGAAAVGAALMAALRFGEWPWAALGTFWIVAGCVTFLWLDSPAGGGRSTIFWLLAVVWVTDSFAFFCGRAIGGPRLAPQLSPNKTWAGLVGGLVGAGTVGLVAGGLTGWRSTVSLIFLSLILSLVAQAGDLAESRAKRHFAVKDTSGLIPGHGGVLDRLDGLLAASIAAASLTFVLGRMPL